MSLLPNFFVLGSTSRGPYMRVRNNPGMNRPLVGFLNFDEPQILNPRTKFTTEKSNTGGATQLVHIRSCYNNKYLVGIQHAGIYWVVASADKPNEDTKNPACTLFRVSRYNVSSGSAAVTLFCMGRSMYADFASQQLGILLKPQVSGNTSVFHTSDWESLVILPSKVTFRSEDLDGNYLCSRVLQRYNYHRFEPELDVGDPLVAHELFPTPDGKYRIKNLHFNRFWRRSPNWIWADAQDNNNSNDTLFSFVKISDQLVALRNHGNNYFCGGLTAEGKKDCLNAQYPNISKQTRLMVEERVLNRIISDVVYRLSDSRIYQESILEVTHAFATNDTDEESTISVEFKTSESRTTHWTNTVSVSLTVSVSFNVSFIPFISEGSVETSLSTEYSYEWGEEKTRSSERSSRYDVTVPAKSKRKVTLMCTRGACDVPFSYKQRDLHTNGQWTEVTKDDGIYTGLNSYNYYYESSNA